MYKMYFYNMVEIAYGLFFFLQIFKNILLHIEGYKIWKHLFDFVPPVPQSFVFLSLVESDLGQLSQLLKYFEE